MLSAARSLFPNAPWPPVDLSTGINPVPYPLAVMLDARLTRLPDDADERALREAAASAYGVRGADMVVAAPGTQILISLLPHLLRSVLSVAILSPTYGEHAAAWVGAGAQVREVRSLEALEAADIAVLCNPNNPDGARTDPVVLRGLADRLAMRGGMLVVDEAFADLEPDGLSLAAALPHPAIVILRSFGKTYGLAGLRLGFLLADPDLAARLRCALGPWAISGPALAAGLQALPDREWRIAACARLDADAARLDALLRPHDLRLIGGTRLFRLYHAPAAAIFFRELGEAGILVRRFGGALDRLRFGLPAPGDWTRLATALSTIQARRKGNAAAWTRPGSTFCSAPPG